ncbi:MAG: hypothetical protein GF308_08860 [Candidatus Heimdallarchaeota archaeon]|nr:hypothetical protein [Candidatus Heimdallarchaeota archaeon]
MVNEKKKNQEDFFSAFERSGKESYIPLSDGCEIRALSFEHPPDPQEDIEVFFVPGMITIFPRWEKVVKELNEHYIVHYIETREKFTSHLTRQAKMTIKRMAQDLAEAEKFFGLQEKQYITISSSLGGTLLLEKLAEKAIKPRGSLLVGPTAEIPFPTGTPFLLRFTPAFVMNLFKPAIRWYFRNILVDREAEPEQAKQYVRALNEADFRKVRKCIIKNHNYNGWPILPKIDGRCLLIGATKDKVHKSELTLRMGKAMPNCTFVDLGTNKAAHDTPLVKLAQRFIRQEVVGKEERVGIEPETIDSEEIEPKQSTA